MEGDLTSPSVDLDIVVTVVNNIATVYRVAFEAPIGGETDNKWNIVLSYDDCRKLKQDLKKEGIRMESAFPNSSVLKTITEDDMASLAAWLRELLGWSRFKDYPGSVQMMLSSMFGSPRNKEKRVNLHHFRSDPLLVDAKRQSTKLSGGASGKNFALEADVSGHVAHLPSGWLVKRGHNRKNWLRRYCVITPGGSMVYYEDDTCLNAKGSIPLALYWVDLTVDANMQPKDQEGSIGFILHQTHCSKEHSTYHFRVEIDTGAGEAVAARESLLDRLLLWKTALLSVGVGEKEYVPPEVGFWSGMA